MKYLSQVFQPIISIPRNATIKNTEITCKSQKLLLECGLVRPCGSGLFSLLPLARRALHKLETLVRRTLDARGAQQMSLPSLTSDALWRRSGREEGQPELFRLQDRHDKKYLLAPTHEEAIADLLADVGPLSYKQLPFILYQITSKYRDEHRPKHGLLRAREFTMLDGYGLHAHMDSAYNTYEHISKGYKHIFEVLGLPVYRVEAPVGSMGGALSHEWQLPAEAGEDRIYACTTCHHSTRDTHAHTCEKCGGKMEGVNCIEVGHTFVLGTRYSSPLAANFVSSDGTSCPVVMSCYGLGLTRLLAASVEHLSTEKALRWPRGGAPYDTIIIGPKEGSKEWSNHGPERVEEVFDVLTSSSDASTSLSDASTSLSDASTSFSDASTSFSDVIIDNRHNYTIGKRLMMADRMGYPNKIVCGKATLDDVPKYEVYTNGESKPRLLTLEELRHFDKLDLEIIKVENK